ncbi:hypothetical protein LH86_16655 [Cedecea neteri]|nr:hypothetical protein LH86_16655 [Cedecea neteri]
MVYHLPEFVVFACLITTENAAVRPERIFRVTQLATWFSLTLFLKSQMRRIVYLLLINLFYIKWFNVIELFYISKGFRFLHLEGIVLHS